MRQRLLGWMLAAAALAPGYAAAQAPRPTTRQTAPARPAPAPAAPQGLQVPAAATLVILIKSTLVAFSQANRTNIYHVFHGLGSDAFRAGHTPDGLAQQFAAFRNAKVDLYPVIVLNPQLIQQPAIQQNRLHLVGFFPTSPVRINFDMWFEPSEGQWKMAQLGLNLSQAPAQPPQQPNR